MNWSRLGALWKWLIGNSVRGIMCEFFICQFIKMSLLCVCADTERGQWKCQEGFPPRGRAADQPSTWTHSDFLWSLRGERPSHHGVWVHETRRPQQVPQAWIYYLLHQNVSLLLKKLESIDKSDCTVGVCSAVWKKNQAKSSKCSLLKDLIPGNTAQEITHDSNKWITRHA